MSRGLSVGNLTVAFLILLAEMSPALTARSTYTERLFDPNDEKLSNWR